MRVRSSTLLNLCGLLVLGTCLPPAAHSAGPLQQGITTAELIFETPPVPSCHASTIIETPSGLMAAWFAGTDEKDPDVGIWMSHKTADGWSKPRLLVDGSEQADQDYACWNPVLFQPREGPLMLFYKVGIDPSSWWGMVITSTDNGQTWSVPRRLPDGILGPIKNKPVQLANGDILSGTSTEHDGWRIHFERSTDGGQTWTATPPLNDGREIKAIQPSILTHADGRLQAIGRSNRGRLFETWSADAGLTWSPLTLTSLPNPNSGTDAVTLKDGRHLLIYNHVAKGRSPLNAAISSDGKVWEAALTLENQPGEYSYPAVIQGGDGTIHVTYTWQRKRIKYVAIDPEQLEPKPFVNGQWPVP